MYGRARVGSAQRRAPPPDLPAAGGALAPERCTRHRYDCATGQWHTEDVDVEIEHRPFTRGGMRSVHRAWEVDRSGGRIASVVKFSLIHSGSRSREREACMRDARAQCVAEFYAGMYNRLGSAVPEKISFVGSDALELRQRGGRFANIEPMLSGDYVKHNDNAGHVATRDPSAQAFSHFSYEASHHQLLVCDIQGVGGLYTDPQIHSDPSGVGEPFGDGDLRSDGIRRFFASHRCNSICAAIGLPKNEPRPGRAPSGSGMMMPMDMGRGMGAGAGGMDAMLQQLMQRVGAMPVGSQRRAPGGGAGYMGRRPIAAPAAAPQPQQEHRRPPRLSPRRAAGAAAGDRELERQEAAAVERARAESLQQQEAAQVERALRLSAETAGDHDLARALQVSAADAATHTGARAPRPMHHRR
eukprot:TRINITY_DN929_c1_g2_i1.p1 TRINITY_DN929_c1_g2~~TRINITY_DN929_c1_g2_i1.p1  ORF type:complete len:437 (+),score=101.44 TRINITY_DN929_c1_g2_i1:74-1312(+)